MTFDRNAWRRDRRRAERATDPAAVVERRRAEYLRARRECADCRCAIGPRSTRCPSCAGLLRAQLRQPRPPRPVKQRPPREPKPDAPCACGRIAALNGRGECQRCQRRRYRAAAEARDPGGAYLRAKIARGAKARACIGCGEEVSCDALRCYSCAAYERQRVRREREAAATHAAKLARAIARADAGDANPRVKVPRRLCHVCLSRQSRSDRPSCGRCAIAAREKDRATRAATPCACGRIGVTRHGDCARCHDRRVKRARYERDPERWRALDRARMARWFARDPERVRYLRKIAKLKRGHGCADCGTMIEPESTRCRPCANQARRQP